MFIYLSDISRFLVCSVRIIGESDTMQDFLASDDDMVSNYFKNCTFKFPLTLVKYGEVFASVNYLIPNCV